MSNVTTQQHLNKLAMRERLQKKRAQKNFDKKKVMEEEEEELKKKFNAYLSEKQGFLDEKSEAGVPVQDTIDELWLSFQIERGLLVPIDANKKKEAAAEQLMKMDEKAQKKREKNRAKKQRQKERQKKKKEEEGQGKNIKGMEKADIESLKFNLLSQPMGEGNRSVFDEPNTTQVTRFIGEYIYKGGRKKRTRKKRKKKYKKRRTKKKKKRRKRRKKTRRRK